MTRTIIITGASDGIGRAAARVLGEAGHTVVVVGRSPEKTRAIAEELGSRWHIADFARLKDIRPTADGHEMTFQLNRLAAFLRSKLMLPRLIASKATVVATSSSFNHRGRIQLDELDGQRKYSAIGAYSAAKSANILARELHRKYSDVGVAAVSFESGPVASNSGAGSTLLMRLVYHIVENRFLLSPEQGADTLMWLAGSSPGVDWSPGLHYGKRKPVSANHLAEDTALGEGLWEHTERMAQ
jgi:NAD(P)-dependent dehydrogenase (short-subunit alcohol dehydrogenase family)